MGDAMSDGTPHLHRYGFGSEENCLDCWEERREAAIAKERRLKKQQEQAEAQAKAALKILDEMADEAPGCVDLSEELA